MTYKRRSWWRRSKQDTTRVYSLAPEPQPSFGTSPHPAVETFAVVTADDIVALETKPEPPRVDVWSQARPGTKYHRVWIDADRTSPGRIMEEMNPKGHCPVAKKVWWPGKHLTGMRPVDSLACANCAQLPKGTK